MSHWASPTDIFKVSKSAYLFLLWSWPETKICRVLQQLKTTEINYDCRLSKCDCNAESLRYLGLLGWQIKKFWDVSTNNCFNWYEEREQKYGAYTAKHKARSKAGEKECLGCKILDIGPGYTMYS